MSGLIMWEGVRSDGVARFVEHDAVGEVSDVVEVVRDEDRGEGVFIDEVTHEPAQRDAGWLVECTEWLVEQQQRRSSGERACERDALLLAAGQGGGGCGREVAGVDAFEPFLGVAPSACTVTVTNADNDVVERGPVSEQRSVLEDHADLPLLRWYVQAAGRVGDDFAADADGAVGRTEQAGDGGERDALAGTGRPEQCGDPGCGVEGGGDGEVADRRGRVDNDGVAGGVHVRRLAESWVTANSTTIAITARMIDPVRAVLVSPAWTAS